MQKATRLIFCLFIVLLFIFPSIGEAAGQVKNADEVANETENFKKVQSLISDGTIYDIGLSTDPYTAITWMRTYYPSFDELCEDSITIESLRKMIEAEEEDTLRKILLEEWLHYLVYGTVTAEGVRVASYEWKDDTVPYTLVLPSRKTIPALKYIGSRTPPRYPNDSDYSAILKKSSSYRYNCHAFSWYFGGDVSGIANSDLLQIPDPKRFYKYGYSPYCVTEVGTPRKGDIVIYIPCSCQSEAHSQKKPVHSATILSVSGSTHNKIIVRSKWGIFGEYQHAISECPYYLSILPHGDSSCSPGRIEYYRPSHQFSSYKPLNTGFHNVICYCCGVISHKEPHSFIYSAGIYRCSKCGFKQVSPSSYEEE